MADDTTTSQDAEDPGTPAAEDPGDAFGGLPDLIANLGTVNGLLDSMVVKLGTVSTSLDDVIAKLAQIDTQSGGAPGQSASGETLSAPGGET